ncbi:uncharacterized protein I303_105804 [Kwoniella dejecticola CBS 10117]|uniref:Uncharacterized protein n=1 Tax=Kwoniella dejecticola CBS 10117 TaxID=1296121 RepID=A0A1A6A0H6_9TREE|nr:uncharacterized protein I303_05826 [Kwoniella dejecticola CBS 10117]OBR83546.1 hypothetical protein I303_05826 [Kwoniella dejecticola CBS 10117]
MSQETYFSRTPSPFLDCDAPSKYMNGDAMTDDDMYGLDVWNPLDVMEDDLIQIKANEDVKEQADEFEVLENCNSQYTPNGADQQKQASDDETVKSDSDEGYVDTRKRSISPLASSQAIQDQDENERRQRRFVVEEQDLAVPTWVDVMIDERKIESDQAYAELALAFGDLTERFSKDRIDSAKLRQKLNELRQEARNRQDAYEVLEIDREKMKARYDEIVKESQADKKEIRALKETNDILDGRNDKLTNALISREEALKGCRAQISELKDKIQNLDHILKTQEKLAIITDSSIAKKAEMKAIDDREAVEETMRQEEERKRVDAMKKRRLADEAELEEMEAKRVKLLAMIQERR